MPTSGGAPGADGQLSRYVRAYLRDHDLSARQLAARAYDERTDRYLLHGWISALAQGTVSRAPEMWRLRALATAMRVPVQTVAEMAASQWLGVEVAGFKAKDDTVIVSVPPDLSPEARAKLVAMAEDLARHMAD